MSDPSTCPHAFRRSHVVRRSSRRFAFTIDGTNYANGSKLEDYFDALCAPPGCTVQVGNTGDDADDALLVSETLVVGAGASVTLEGATAWGVARVNGTGGAYALASVGTRGALTIRSLVVSHFGAGALRATDGATLVLEVGSRDGRVAYLRYKVMRWRWKKM